MPGIPDLIMKAPVFRRLEDLSRDTRFWENEAARTALKIIVLHLDDPTKKLIDIAKAGWLYDNASSAHFERHWLNSQNDGYWKTIQNELEAVLRAGMKRACEIFIASGYSKPFEYFWAISGDVQSTRWEMSICEGVNQVTVIFHTPQTPASGASTIDYPSITIARYDTANAKATLQPLKVPV